MMVKRILELNYSKVCVFLLNWIVLLFIFLTFCYSILKFNDFKSILASIFLKNQETSLSSKIQ